LPTCHGHHGGSSLNCTSWTVELLRSELSMTSPTKSLLFLLVLLALSWAKDNSEIRGPTVIGSELENDDPQLLSQPPPQPKKLSQQNDELVRMQNEILPNFEKEREQTILILNAAQQIQKTMESLSKVQHQLPDQNKGLNQSMESIGQQIKVLEKQIIQIKSDLTNFVNQYEGNIKTLLSLCSSNSSSSSSSSCWDSSEWWWNIKNRTEVLVGYLASDDGRSEVAKVLTDYYYQGLKIVQNNSDEMANKLMGYGIPPNFKQSTTYGLTIVTFILLALISIKLLLLFSRLFLFLLCCRCFRNDTSISRDKRKKKKKKE